MKRSIGITVLGIANLIKCLWGGWYYLILGFLLILSIMGLGLGMIFVICGFILLRGVKPAFLLLKLNPQARKSTINISIVSSLVSMHPLFWEWGRMGMNLSTLTVLIVNILSLYLFMPHIKEQFKEANQEGLTSKEKTLLVACNIIFALLDLLWVFKGYLT